jgi:hypothetical protein
MSNTSTENMLALQNTLGITLRSTFLYIRVWKITMIVRISPFKGL